MRTTLLAPDLEISRVLTGLWQIADVERRAGPVDPVSATEAMHRYVEAGFTSFDMADHYGSAELIAGAYERAHPGRARLLTKWVPEPGPVTPGLARAAVDRARERMHQSRLDLLQLHAWSYADPAWLDAVFHLDDLRREGLIRHLGLTNTDTVHVAMLLDSGVPIVSNQVSYSLLDRRAAGAMTDLCFTRDVKLLAFGTLAGGFLSERWLGVDEPAPEELETWSQMKYKRFIDAAGGWGPFQRLLQTVSRQATRLGVSIANVATRWVLDRPAVAGVIVGARLSETSHVGDNARVFDFALDREANEALEAAATELDPIPGDCGDEYRRPPFLTAAGDLSHHVEAFPAPYPTRAGPAGRTLVSSGTEWEEMAGFSRAVRVENRVLVSGTTATHGARLIGGDDPASQAHFCIDKIEGALASLGAALEDVVRTRIYVASERVASAVSRVHAQRLGAVRPANTLVVAGLVGEGHLVEIEAEAVLT